MPPDNTPDDNSNRQGAGRNFDFVDLRYEDRPPSDEANNEFSEAGPRGPRFTHLVFSLRSRAPYHRAKATARAIRMLKRIPVAELDEADLNCTICYEPLEDYKGPIQDTGMSTDSKDEAETVPDDVQGDGDDDEESQSLQSPQTAPQPLHNNRQESVLNDLYGVPRADIQPGPQSAPQETETEAAHGEQSESTTSSTTSSSTSSVEIPQVPDDHSPTGMPCGHIFGRSCLHSWLKRNTTCPICRAAVEGEDGADGEDQEFHTFNLDVYVPDGESNGGDADSNIEHILRGHYLRSSGPGFLQFLRREGDEQAEEGADGNADGPATAQRPADSEQPADTPMEGVETDRNRERDQIRPGISHIIHPIRADIRAATLPPSFAEALTNSRVLYPPRPPAGGGGAGGAGGAAALAGAALAGAPPSLPQHPVLELLQRDRDRRARSATYRMEQARNQQASAMAERQTYMTLVHSFLRRSTEARRTHRQNQPESDGRVAASAPPVPTAANVPSGSLATNGSSPAQDRLDVPAEPPLGGLDRPNPLNTPLTASPDTATPSPSITSDTSDSSHQSNRRRRGPMRYNNPGTRDADHPYRRSN